MAMGCAPNVALQKSSWKQYTWSLPTCKSLSPAKTTPGVAHPAHPPARGRPRALRFKTEIGWPPTDGGVEPPVRGGQMRLGEGPAADARVGVGWAMLQRWSSPIDSLTNIRSFGTPSGIGFLLTILFICWLCHHILLYTNTYPLKAKKIRTLLT